MYVSYCHPTAAAMLFLIPVPTSGREHINGGFNERRLIQNSASSRCFKGAHHDLAGSTHGPVHFEQNSTAAGYHTTNML